jgi:hypothetical protein
LILVAIMPTGNAAAPAAVFTNPQLLNNSAAIFTPNIASV